MATTSNLRIRRVRLTKEEREKLAQASQRYNIPKQVILRTGVDIALDCMSEFKQRRQLPAELAVQLGPARRKRGEPRALEYICMSVEQDRALKALSRKFDIPKAGLMRLAVCRGLDELHRAPENGIIPTRFQQQILPDSYAGFTTHIRRGVKARPGPRLNVQLSHEENERARRISDTLGIPVAAIVRRGLIRELDELERTRRSEIPLDYHGAELRGTEFRQNRRRPSPRGKGREESWETRRGRK